ncbi:hypothetical protein V6N13_082811 [Hibiscus sabdariffa]
MKSRRSSTSCYNACASGSPSLAILSLSHQLLHLYRRPIIQVDGLITEPSAFPWVPSEEAIKYANLLT